MVRGRFRVDGARVCFEPPRGDLVTVCGRWAGRDAGEGTKQGPSEVDPGRFISCRSNCSEGAEGSRYPSP